MPAMLLSLRSKVSTYSPTLSSRAISESCRGKRRVLLDRTIFFFFLNMSDSLHKIKRSVLPVIKYRNVAPYER
jgi:hypothetical protein